MAPGGGKKDRSTTSAVRAPGKGKGKAAGVLATHPRNQLVFASAEYPPSEDLKAPTQQDKRNSVESLVLMPQRTKDKPLAGLSICVTGCKADKQELLRIVPTLGGTADHGLRNSTTHLIADQSGSDKFEAAVKRKRKIMLPSWIYALRNGITSTSPQSANFDAIDQKHTMPCFHSLRICMYKFPNHDPSTPGLKRLLQKHGAALTVVPSKTTTHLILHPSYHLPSTTSSAGGESNPHADFRSQISAKAKVVWSEWIREVLSSGGITEAGLTKWSWTEGGKPQVTVAPAVLEAASDRPPVARPSPLRSDRTSSRRDRQSPVASTCHPPAKFFSTHLYGSTVQTSSEPALFAGLKFLIMLEPLASATLVDAIKARGGSIVSDREADAAWGCDGPRSGVEGTVAHFIVAPYFLREQTDDSRVVSSGWIERCIFEGALVPPSRERLLERPLPYFCPLPVNQCLLFFDVRSFASAWCNNKRQVGFSPPLVLDNEPTGSKANKAREWGIPIVSLRWLREWAAAAAGVKLVPLRETGSWNSNLGSPDEGPRGRFSSAGLLTLNLMPFGKIDLGLSAPGEEPELESFLLATKAPSIVLPPFENGQPVTPEPFNSLATPPIILQLLDNMPSSAPVYDAANGDFYGLKTRSSPNKDAISPPIRNRCLDQDFSTMFEADGDGLNSEFIYQDGEGYTFTEDPELDAPATEWFESPFGEGAEDHVPDVEFASDAEAAEPGLELEARTPFVLPWATKPNERPTAEDIFVGAQSVLSQGSQPTQDDDAVSVIPESQPTGKGVQELLLAELERRFPEAISYPQLLSPAHPTSSPLQKECTLQAPAAQQPSNKTAPFSVRRSLRQQQLSSEKEYSSDPVTELPAFPKQERPPPPAAGMSLLRKHTSTLLAELEMAPVEAAPTKRKTRFGSRKKSSTVLNIDQANAPQPPLPAPNRPRFIPGAGFQLSQFSQGDEYSIDMITFQDVAGERARRCIAAALKGESEPPEEVAPPPVASSPPAQVLVPRGSVGVEKKKRKSKGQDEEIIILGDSLPPPEKKRRGKAQRG